MDVAAYIPVDVRDRARINRQGQVSRVTSVCITAWMLQIVALLFGKPHQPLASRRDGQYFNPLLGGPQYPTLITGAAQSSDFNEVLALCLRTENAYSRIFVFCHGDGRGVRGPKCCAVTL
jgi:hypothetical protein